MENVFDNNAKIFNINIFFNLRILKNCIYLLKQQNTYTNSPNNFDTGILKAFILSFRSEKESN